MSLKTRMHKMVKDLIADWQDSGLGKGHCTEAQYLCWTDEEYQHYQETGQLPEEEETQHPNGWMTDGEYESSLGVICPRCKEEDVNLVGDLDAQEGAAFQDCRCGSCGLHWSDGYFLKTYDPQFCDCKTPEMSTSFGETHPRCLACGYPEEPK